MAVRSSTKDGGQIATALFREHLFRGCRTQVSYCANEPMPAAAGRTQDRHFKFCQAMHVAHCTYNNPREGRGRFTRGFGYAGKGRLPRLCAERKIHERETLVENVIITQLLAQIKAFGSSYVAVPPHESDTICQVRRQYLLRSWPGETVAESPDCW